EPVVSGTQGNIVILYTNDMHCAIGGNIGLDGVAGLKKHYQDIGDSVVLVDAGDAIQGEPIGTLSAGASVVEVMNAAGYDFATPGNHEFDYGMDNFLTLAGELAQYTYLSCNFTDLLTGQPVFAPYAIVEMAGKKVAFMGISTPRTLTSTTPAFFKDAQGEYIYGFCQDLTGEALYACVQATADAARAEGADYVIALAHLGIAYDECTPYTSSEVIVATSGIDAVLDGHSHSVIEGEIVKNKDGADVLLTSTGTKLNSVGTLIITPDGVMSSFLTRRYVDADVTKLIGEINAKHRETLAQVVAQTDVPLVINEPSTIGTDNVVRIVRNAETNLGNLCADAYRFVSGADIAFVNGGGVRADIAAGEITYNNILTVHPYGNEMCVIEASGQQILDALETGARAVPAENGGFLQVSGLTYEIHTYIESSVVMDEVGMFTHVDGEYRVKNVKVGGEDLVLDKIYTLASHNFMLKSGGDGMAMFLGSPLLQDSVMLDNQVLMNYIIDGLGGIVGEQYADPYGEGRIIAVTEP
ncbi:MAG: bifunctional metallophosphatase/5'-nucleotidase, partial [Clostridia bacterium]|nr:bifunctional metallophosphatase/5'-nucleotidase [Clostridia bacterium]